ncbi:MAG: hypothetical protein CL946_00090, partial [Ectothiorhodospiraceae bacterium]|nr:hypothetical protein [Ectothiorhodospiraceae bacterium]
KKDQTEEAARLYIEEGIRDQAEIRERTGLSRTTIWRMFKMPELDVECNKRREAAILAYKRNPERSIESIADEAKISFEHCRLVILRSQAREERLKQFNEHQEQRDPNVPSTSLVFTTMNILHQAALDLAHDVRAKGYTGQNVKQLQMLMTSLRKFDSGDYMLELAVYGLTIAEYAAEDVFEDEFPGGKLEHFVFGLYMLKEYLEDLLEEENRRMLESLQLVSMEFGEDAEEMNKKFDFALRLRHRISEMHSTQAKMYEAEKERKTQSKKEGSDCERTEDGITEDAGTEEDGSHANSPSGCSNKGPASPSK